MRSTARARSSHPAARAAGSRRAGTERRMGVNAFTYVTAVRIAANRMPARNHVFHRLPRHGVTSKIAGTYAIAGQFASTRRCVAEYTKKPKTAADTMASTGQADR